MLKRATPEIYLCCVFTSPAAATRSEGWDSTRPGRAIPSPAFLWAGWPFFERGWQSLMTRNLNMFTLIALGTGVAYLFSIVATLAPSVFPAAFRGHDGAVAVYFEAAAVIVTLALIGQVLELRARSRTNAAVKSLLALAPATATRVGPDGSEKEIPLSDVQISDLLRVKPGGTYVDGTVGSAGHAVALLERAGADGYLLGIDRDREALDRAAGGRR